MGWEAVTASKIAKAICAVAEYELGLAGEGEEAKARHFLAHAFLHSAAVHSYCRRKRVNVAHVWNYLWDASRADLLRYLGAVSEALAEFEARPHEEVIRAYGSFA